MVWFKRRHHDDRLNAQEARYVAQREEGERLRRAGWSDVALRPPPPHLFVEIQQACGWGGVRRASDLPRWADVSFLFWRPLQGDAAESFGRAGLLSGSASRAEVAEPVVESR